MPGNAMFAFKVHFKAGWLFCPKLPLREKSAVHKNICCWSYFGLKDLHEFIFAGGTIGNKFVSKFKMSLWEKMLLSIKTAHFKFTLIRLNNKSLPKSFVKVSAEQNNCSLDLILRTLCRSSRDKESHFSAFVE